MNLVVGKLWFKSVQILVQRLRSELELYKVLGFTHCSSSVLFV